IPFRLTLPHKGFHREIGNFAGLFISPEGEALTEEAWKKHEFEWLPSPQDYAFVQSLMSGRVTEPGKFANWIAPPLRGINNQPLHFEYVRFKMQGLVVDAAERRQQPAPAFRIRPFQLMASKARAVSR